MRPCLFQRLVSLAGLFLTLTVCRQPAAPSANARFSLRDSVNADVFRVEIRDSVTVTQAESLMRSHQGRFVIGTLQAGDDGYNAPWHWHLEPASVTLGEGGVIELCITTPRALEGSLDYSLRLGIACIYGGVEARER